MLGKLIKQEFKATYKIILFVLALTLVFGVLGRFIFTSTLLSANPNTVQLITGATFVILYIGLIFVVSFACQLYIAVRFYRSLFSSQGYLSFTLPVTPTQLLHSKIIVGSIWGISSIATIFSALFITCYTPTVAAMFQTAFMNDATLNSFFIQMICYTVITTILGVISGQIMIFSCICIGQLFNKNRVVASIVTYGIMYTVLQIITSIITFAMNFDYVFSTSTTYSSTYTTEYFTNTFSQTFVISIILGIVTYVVCHYIMNKKVNLV